MVVLGFTQYFIEEGKKEDDNAAELKEKKTPKNNNNNNFISILQSFNALQTSKVKFTNKC